MTRAEQLVSEGQGMIDREISLQVDMMRQMTRDYGRAKAIASMVRWYLEDNDPHVVAAVLAFLVAEKAL